MHLRKQFRYFGAIGIVVSLLAFTSSSRAAVIWTSGQFLPSFSTPASILDLMDVRNTIRYEAEGSQVLHMTGQLDGDGWTAIPGRDTANTCIIYGPYVTNIPAGANTAHYGLKIDNRISDNADVVRIDVNDFTSGTVLATRTITRQEFKTTSNYTTFDLPFNNTTAGDSLEFRVYWMGNATIKCNYVGVETKPLDDAQILYTSLKGVVNKTQPRIYSYDDWMVDNEGKTGWLTALGLNYTEVTDKQSLLTKYRSEISGLIVYDENMMDTINLATTIAGLNNGLVVPPSMVATLTAAPYNLPILVDLRGQFTSKLAVYQYLYNNYWPQCNHKMLAGLDPIGVKGTLRDYVIATNSAAVWLDPNVPAELTLLNSFFSGMPSGSAYMGWWPDEYQGIKAASNYGITTVASDWSSNLTVYGGQSRTVNVKSVPNKPPLQNKIYVSFVMSDGDNVQYMEHLFKHVWDDSGRGSVPLGWTVSPALLDAAPGILNWIYNTATPNDCLVSGPSGLGYTYPNVWTNSASLDSYTARSNDYCNRAGLRAITVWGDGVQGATNVNVGNSYAMNALSLLGLTAQNAGGGWTVYNNRIPSMGLSGNYCSLLSEIQSAVTAGSSGFNGTAPCFISIQAVAWNFTPTDIENYVNTLNSNYVVVRPDTFFQLYRESKQLPVEPNDIVKQYEAENTTYENSPFSHNVGRADGDAWSANTTQDSTGFMLYGPYVTGFPTGQLTTSFKLKIDSITGTNDKVATLDIRNHSTGIIMNSVDIYRNQFKASNTYQDFSLTFDNPAGSMLEFRINYLDKAKLSVDKVTTLKCLGKYEAEGTVISHNTGHAVVDGWQATPSDALTHMIYGPYDANVPVGNRKVTFRMKIDNNTLDNQKVATLDVNDTTTGVLTSVDITRQQFAAADTYQDFSVSFNQTAINHMLEYRVCYYKVGTVTVDKITIN